MHPPSGACPARLESAGIHACPVGSSRCFGGPPPRQLDHFFASGPLAVTVILWALFAGFLAIVTVITPASNFDLRIPLERRQGGRRDVGIGSLVRSR